ncbi:MAG: hypothetical protein AAFV59_13255 [Pseudomonadota bacterium]
MVRVIGWLVLATSLLATSMVAFAQKQANGMVIEHDGDQGELIVSRDGIVYWLSTGDDLYSNDVLRAQNADMATIVYNGCVMTLPQKEDVTLDEEFCALVVLDEPAMAQVANESGVLTGSSTITTAANAPLVVGGVVLSSAGLVAAVDGGRGGTGSAASAAAGAAQAGVDP